MTGSQIMSPQQRQHTMSVLGAVNTERMNQHAKWGEQNHPDGTSSTARILERTDTNLDLRTGVELAEIFRAKCQRNGPGKDTYRDILLEEVFEALACDDPADLRDELVQVAAVAVAWVEKLDREAAKP